MLVQSAGEVDLASSFVTAPDVEIEALLWDFLCCKYFLDPEDLNTDNLVALGDMSTAKMAGFQKAGIVFQEKSAGCTIASPRVLQILWELFDGESVAEVSALQVRLFQETELAATLTSDHNTGVQTILRRIQNVMG